MKILSGRFLTVISVLILSVVPVKNTISCGPELDPDEARFMLFKPDMGQGDGLSSFYYAARILNDTGGDPVKIDIHRNCNEWAAAYGKVAGSKDIYNIIYGVKPDDFQKCYNKNNWDNLPGNVFLNWLRIKKNRPWLNYLAFARKVEYMQIGNQDKWGNSRLNNTQKDYDQLAETALQQINKSKQKFLKERYAFQAVKLLNYASLYVPYDHPKRKEYNNRIGKCYEAYLKGKHTIVADWALVYYAECLDDPKKRALCLLEAFDRTIEKKVTVFWRLNKSDLEPLKTTVHDPKTLATIYAFEAIKSPGRALNDIKLVYKYDHTSKYLPLLISREVNKLEDWILSPVVLGFRNETGSGNQDNYFNSKGAPANFATKNLAKDKLYLEQVRTSLSAMLTDNTVNADFLKLAIVHLYHIEGKYEDAKNYLATIHDFTNRKYLAQFNIEKAISLICQSDLQSGKARQELDDVFTQLEQLGYAVDYKAQYDYNHNYNRQKDILSELYILLCNRLREKGDIVTSGLLFQKAKIVVNAYYGNCPYCSNDFDSSNFYYKISWFDKYGSPNDIDALLHFKHKKHKTSFERRITPRMWASDNAYKDLKGTLLVRQGKFEEALAVMKLIPDNFWKENFYFSEYLKRSSISAVWVNIDEKKGDLLKYQIVSKKTILKDIVALRAALKYRQSDSVRASLYFLLGNCYYNISYHGKDWMMYSYGKSSNERNNGRYSGNENWACFTFYPGSIRFGKSYYKLADAKTMYQEAMKYIHNNKELAAQCVLMLSRCETDAHYYNNKWYDEPKPYISEYLRIFKQKYATTSVYARSVTECPDVKDYPEANGN